MTQPSYKFECSKGENPMPKLKSLNKSIERTNTPVITHNVHFR